MYIGFGLGASSALLAAVFVIGFARPVAQVFTRDPDIILLLQQTMPIFCTAVFVSALHLILAAVVEAMSLAMVLVVVTGIGSWCVILPCSYVFAIPMHGGLEGLWLGSVCGEATKFLSIVLVLYRVDWQAMARRAVKQSEGALDEEELSQDILTRASMSSVTLTPTMGVPSPMISRKTPQLIHHQNHRTDDDEPLLRRHRHSSGDAAYGSL